MTEVELLKLLASGGPVAILAGLIFTMYVRDKHTEQEQARQDKAETEARMTQFIEADQRTREANTRVLAELASATRESANVMREVQILLRTQNSRGGSDG